MERKIFLEFQIKDSNVKIKMVAYVFKNEK